MMVIVFLVNVMDTNTEIGKETELEVLLAALLRIQVANNTYWLFLFWTTGFWKMKAQRFLEA
jgi:hypothetical protein